MLLLTVGYLYMCIYFLISNSVLAFSSQGYDGGAYPRDVYM